MKNLFRILEIEQRIASARDYLVRSLLLFGLLFSSATYVAQAQKTARSTALDRYVRAQDSHYSYELKETIPGKGYTSYLIEMTSQAWRKPEEVDKTVWKHWLVIVRPDVVKHQTGILFIRGGSSNDKKPG